MSALDEPTILHAAERSGAHHLASPARRLLVNGAIFGSWFLGGGAAVADPLTDDQTLVAEAWKLTDSFFVDRTFAGQDWFQVRQKMVRKKYDNREDAYEEIRTMLSKLNDKYTRFLTPSQYENIYSAATTGEAVGIGVQLEEVTPEPTDGKARVRFVSIFDESPAEAAGLKRGDVIQVIGDEDVGGLGPGEVAAKIRGTIGSKLRLSILRPGETEPQVKILERKKFKQAVLKSSMQTVNGQKVGYIRIGQFASSTTDDFKTAISDLSGNGATSYVIDLRGNPGGYFPSGVDVARLFLKKNMAVTYVVTNKNQQIPYAVFEDGPYSDAPLVILVDDQTASASEVFSSGMQGNGRAKLVGPKPMTYGKAVIQTINQLSDKSAISVTEGTYLTPKKEYINGRGIAVDAVRDCPPGASAVACVGPELR